MARYEAQESFLDTLKHLHRQQRERVLKALQKFGINHRLPGLNHEKLKGHENLWTIRVSQGDRIFMSQDSDAEGEVWLLWHFGPHDDYRKW